MASVTEIMVTTMNITCEEYLNRTCDNSSITTTGPTPTKSGNNSWDDATWILTSAFVIFTMQSGFGLLESGLVSRKNEVNIMVKNAVDVLFGGLTYWMFGYAFSFGDDPGSNQFCGIGYFFTDSTDEDEMGWTFAKFVFQASFATTATTIVSGAMAERTKLESYCVFSLINTLIYCFPAHWAWADNGYFYKLGAVDIAGAGAVHLIGGLTGLVATLMLKPRRGRFSEKGLNQEMSNPTNALLGMFMLWWGWLGFNCGSTFGISGGKWKLATRAACTTITASIGGGIIGIGSSWLTKKRQFDIGYIINGVLGGLVSCTAMCALCRPWEGLVIGIIGGAIAVYTPPILERMKIDDPVGVVGVHCISAYWGLLSVGLFAQPDNIEGITTMSGLFYGGGFKLFGIQLYMAVVMTVWTLTLAFLMLYVIEKTIGLRCSEEHEILGADLCEHGIIQLSLAEKLEMTKELIKSGYQSPFMDELRAAAIQPDFLKHSVRRSSRMSLVIPTISNNVKSVNGDLNIHENTLRDGSVSIDIENNWNLKSSPLIHRGENGRSSVTSNGWSPSMTPQAEGNGHCSGKENAAFDHNELEDAKKVENTDNISSKNHQVVI